MVDDANVPTLVLDTNPTASGGSNDMVHVTGDDAGFYDLELAAGNVNYLGRAMLAITDAAVHCPVFHEFMILPANIYDSLVLGTDLVDVSVTQFAGSAITSASGIPEVKVASIAANAITATAINADAITDAKVASDVTIASVTGAVGSVTGAVGSVTGAVGSVTGNVGGNVTGSVGSVAAGGITASSIATDAIDADAIKADAITEIQAGLATAAALATVDGIVDDILLDTAEIGPAGAGLTEAGGTGDQLTALPWNAAWDAEVQSEAEDALAAYDPPTRTEATADKAEILAKLQGLVLVTGTIGSTGNDATHLHLDGLTYGNDEINGLYLVVFDSSEAEYHVRDITDWVLASELATVATLPFTPEDATDTYWLLAAVASSVVGGDATEAKQDAIIALIGTPANTDLAGDLAAIPTAAETRAEIDSNSTQLAAIVADTNEVQAELADGGRTDLLIDAILADTGELQTDWVNGGRLDLILDARSSQTSVDDLPTNTELATALGTADDATLSAIAALSIPTAAAIADAVWDEAATGHTDAGKAGEQLWTDVDAILVDTGTTLQGELDGIQADTEDIQSRLPAALTGGGNIKADALAIEGADPTDTIRDAVVDDATRIDASALNTLSSHDPGEAIMGATDLGTGGGLTTLATQASVDDIPTNAELATALGTADDAVLAAIAALNNLSSSQAATAVLTTQMTEAYAAQGAAPTLAQAVQLLVQLLTENAVSGTTMTVKKLDQSTTAATLTLDDASEPTSLTRAT